MFPEWLSGASGCLNRGDNMHDCNGGYHTGPCDAIRTSMTWDEFQKYRGEILTLSDIDFNNLLMTVLMEKTRRKAVDFCSLKAGSGPSGIIEYAWNYAGTSHWNYVEGSVVDRIWLDSHTATQSTWA